MNCPKSWKIKPLSKIANISFSNVDKKTHTGQTTVSLCNYMDVFSNKKIINGMSFMRASASDNEIKKFKLSKGDMVFTKDSEDPLEIGVPSFISDDIPDLICGYHLGIAKPKEGINGEYLTFSFQAEYTRKQLARMANGISRYGIGLKEINNLKILTPPLAEQERIVEILSDCDTSISIAERHMSHFLAAEKQKINDLVNQFSKQYEIELIGSIAEITVGTSKTDSLNDSGKYVVLDMGGVSEDGELISKKRTNQNADALKSGDLVIPKDDIGEGRILGKAGFVNKHDTYVLGDHVFKLSCNMINPKYLQTAINSSYVRRQIFRIATGSAQLGINKKNFVKIEVPAPPLDIQKIVAAHRYDFDLIREKLASRIIAFKKQKRGLMQKLLTGKLRVPLKNGATK